MKTTMTMVTREIDDIARVLDLEHTHSFSHIK